MVDAGLSYVMSNRKTSQRRKRRATDVKQRQNPCVWLRDYLPLLQHGRGGRCAASAATARCKRQCKKRTAEAV
jgi:hypothetical protein